MGARRLTFGALPTGCGPVGRLRPGSLPGRGGSLHGQPSRLEEARRNPSSQLATGERLRARGGQGWVGRLKTWGRRVLSGFL